MCLSPKTETTGEGVEKWKFLQIHDNFITKFPLQSNNQFYSQNFPYNLINKMSTIFCILHL